MAPNPKVLAAFRAMKDLGITEEKVKPVLKNLLKLYEKNWELIEEENYRVLADAIFDEDDSKASEQKKKSRITDEEDLEEEAQVPEEPERPLKRLRLRGQEGQASSSVRNRSPRSGGTSLKRPKVEEEELPATFSSQPSQDTMDSAEPPAQNMSDEPRLPGTRQNTRSRHMQPVSPKSLASQGVRNPPQPNVTSRSNLLSSQIGHGDKRKEPASPHDPLRVKRSISDRASHAVRSKEPAVEPGILMLPKQKVPVTNALIKPKDEPFTDDVPEYEVPIAVIHPDQISKGGSDGNVPIGPPHDLEPSTSQCVNEGNRGEDVLALSNETRTNSELATVAEESPSNMEIASSTMGEVKISLSFNSASSDFHMPSIDSVIKLMEDKCLRTYKIIDPNFSLKEVLNELCKSALEMGTDSTPESQEKPENDLPALDLLKKPAAQDALHIGDNMEISCVPASSSNGSLNIQFSADMAVQQIPRFPAARNCLDFNVQGSNNITVNGCDKSNEENSRSLAVIPQHELTAHELRSLHDINDITRGEEKINISWANEINRECPPSFHYISQNLVFRSARVSITLYQIEDDHCCPTCIDDCLESSTPCACANETGGEYAYTSEGLIKEHFLEECVLMNHKPQKHHYFYCKECLVERSKNDDVLEPCKGHLRRKFIKECWRKCGCNKQQCGNRVVQRGINHKLQVFMTPEGKGWGLRTLEELPKGAFVCEYVGEILTNIESYERNIRNTKKHSYPVLLDADWGSGVLEDEKALCLDTTSYGNVAKFINHRCLDANLVEIPVEVETPDHSYYHVALFTTRKVDALEELTRDYGIDFDDPDHPVKPFRCECGSKFCRNMKRSNRSRSAVNAR